MKIAVLAPEGSGKSAFMVGLHGDLSKARPRQDVEVRATDPSRKLELDNAFKKLISERKDARFPPKTSSVTETEYRVRCLVSDASLDLILMDYPGGLLRGATSASTYTYDQVHYNLNNADALIVLLDADHLIKYAEDSDEYALDQGTALSDLARVVRECTTRYSQRYSGLEDAALPIAFCVTKFDQYGSLGNAGQSTSSAAGQAFTFVRDSFPEYFEGCMSGATSGSSLTLLTGISLGDNIADSDTALFKPANLLAPFQFCVGMVVQQRGLVAASQSEAYASESRRKIAKANRRDSMGLFEKLRDIVETDMILSSGFRKEAAMLRLISEAEQEQAENDFTVANTLLRKLALHIATGYCGKDVHLYRNGLLADLVEDSEEGHIELVPRR